MSEYTLAGIADGPEVTTPVQRRPRRRRAVPLLTAALAVLAGCGSGDPSPAASPSARPTGDEHTTAEPTTGTDLPASPTTITTSGPPANASGPSGKAQFQLTHRDPPVADADVAAEVRDLGRYLAQLGVTADVYHEPDRIIVTVDEADMDTVLEALRTVQSGMYPVLAAAVVEPAVPGDPLAELTSVDGQTIAASATGETMFLGPAAGSLQSFTAAVVTPGDPPGITLTLRDSDALGLAFANCGERTASCPTGQIALVVGSLVVVAPVVHGIPDGDELTITGSFTAEEAERAAALIAWHSRLTGWEVTSVSSNFAPPTT